MPSPAPTRRAKPPASTIAAMPPVMPYRTSLARSSRLAFMGPSWGEQRPEQRIVETGKGLPTGKRPPGTDHRAHPGTTRREPIAVGTVADQHRRRGRRAGSPHQGDQALGIWLQHADRRVLGRDDVIGLEAEGVELGGCRVVRQDADQFSLGPQPREQFDEAGITELVAGPSEMAQRPPVDPFRDDRAYMVLRGGRGRRRFRHKGRHEVGRLLVAQPLANAAIAGEHPQREQIALAHGMTGELHGHPQAERTLTVERSVHIEGHETYALPIRRGRNVAGGHRSLIYCWLASPSSAGTLTTVSSRNDTASSTTRIINPRSLTSFSGRCADDPGCMDSAM